MSEQMHVRIVPMTGDHLDEVAELERVCFTTPWSRNMLAEELDNYLSAFLVALDDNDKVAGYAGLQAVLDEGYITVNKNTIPNEPLSPFVTSGIRIGTPAVTSRGLKEEDMEVIASCIADVVADFDGRADAVRERVNALCAKYPLY